MREPKDVVVAIIDYGMGNLYSVQQACAAVELPSIITNSPSDVVQADAVILPGVGAMRDAMATLDRSGMAEVLVQHVSVAKPFFGICLGMQLLMTDGVEFGRHKGLGVVEGSVVGLSASNGDGHRLKIPHVGWNAVACFPASSDSIAPWAGTPLEGMRNGECMYVVHSYYVAPADSWVWVAVTRYGDLEFCSALRQGSVFGCQFHPERSGPRGIQIYENFARQVKAARGTTERV